MNRLLIITILVLGFGQINSQTVEIGQDAESVKRIIEWSTNEHNKPDSFGNYSSARVSSDVQYNDGVITDVIQCYRNQFYIELCMSVDFCKHYVMGNGKLAYILTQFENVSTGKLIQAFNRLYGERKQNDLYFEEDYKHCSKIYLSKNGLATIEWKNVKMNQIPSNIRQEIINKQKAQEDEAIQKKLAAEEERKRIEEITSKVYDLYKYNRPRYDGILFSIKKEIKEYFMPSSDGSYHPRSNAPSFSNLANTNEKKYRFSNTYNAYYKLEDQGYSNAGVHRVNQIKKITLIAGTDKTCSLFEDLLIKIPIIEIDGNEVLTEALFENISVDYIRGITWVRIRKDNVEFIKFPPDTDVIEKIRQDIRSTTRGSGQCIIEYEFLKVLGDETIKTQLER